MREKILCEELAALFDGAAAVFAEKREELCEMDAQMGDGDLGLTMSKGYGALPEILAAEAQTGDIGKALMKGGMKLSGIVPSTMGTLMASGLMSGGKAITGVSEMGAPELANFLEGFAKGIETRGKCKPGDRTILDALKPAGEAARLAADGGADLSAVMSAAIEAAKIGVEATKQMKPKFGKAAVFAAKAEGVADQGAVAGLYLLEGLNRFICQD